MTEKITVESVKVGPSDDGKVHVLYTPVTTQMLRAGVVYELIFENISYEDTRVVMHTAPKEGEGG